MVVYKLIPQPGDKRNVSQADILNDFTYLQQSMGNDHNFSLTNPNTSGPMGINNDGFHSIIHFINQGSTVGTPPPNAISGVGQTYTKTINNASNLPGEHLCYQQGTNASNQTETCLTIAPIRASISVNSAGAAIGTPYNATVTHVATGLYTVSFPVNMPSANYQALVTSGFSAASIWVLGTKMVGSIQIKTVNSGGTQIDSPFDLVAIGG